MQLRGDYFAAYRSLKLTRDADGGVDLVKSMRAQNEPVAQRGKVP